MNPNQIETHLKRRPFIPIREYVSDNSSYEIPHLEFAAICMRELAIGIEHLEDSVPERFVYIDPLHVTRIERLERKKPKKNGKPQRKKKS